MSMKDRLVEQGKKLTSSTAFVRLVSNDKVMQLATGVMDARSRFQAVAEHAAEAWSIVLHGHALPTIDPALEGETEAMGRGPKEVVSQYHENGAAKGIQSGGGGGGAAASVRPVELFAETGQVLAQFSRTGFDMGLDFGWPLGLLNNLGEGVSAPSGTTTASTGVATWPNAAAPINLIMS
mgnify:CR=1 FL=1